MTYTIRQARQFHDMCIFNKTAVRASKQVGCFSCVTIFTPDQIKHWVDGDPDHTAMCPYCDVDAVLPESPLYELDMHLLKMMQRRYCHDPEDSTVKPRVFNNYMEIAEFFEQRRAAENLDDPA
jgi:hypothetical protein